MGEIPACPERGGIAFKELRRSLFECQIGESPKGRGKVAFKELRRTLLKYKFNLVFFLLFFNIFLYV